VVFLLLLGLCSAQKKQKIDDNLSIEWIEVSTGVLSISVFSSQLGWIGIGFTDPQGSDTNAMLKADFVIAQFDERGVANVNDYYCPALPAAAPNGTRIPCSVVDGVLRGICLDTDQSGTNDIVSFAGKQEGGTSFYQFIRRINTGDSKDWEIKNGNLIYAYGVDGANTYRYHGTNRGLTKVQWFD